MLKGTTQPADAEPKPIRLMDMQTGDMAVGTTNSDVPYTYLRLVDNFLIHNPEGAVWILRREFITRNHPVTLLPKGTKFIIET